MSRPRPLRTVLVLSLLMIPFSSTPRAEQAGADAGSRARALHMNAIVIDTHADTPQRMLFDSSFDLGSRHVDGHVDIPRMREGGTDAQFFSIWVSSDTKGPAAVRRALDLIDAVREGVRAHPQDLVLATSAADIRRAAADGRIAALMGMEGGHMIDDDIRILRDYAALGIRYLTLTHFKNNNWADASTDKPAHNGLTPFGKEVVRELNRLGVMVDVSHVSDKTFYDVLAHTTAPVMASHSSCRAISNHPRNMSDDMLRALATNGGVIMINYEVSFLSEEYRKTQEAMGKDVVQQLAGLEADCKGDESCVTLAMNRLYRALVHSRKAPGVGWEKIVEHIDHAVKVAGVEHVGLGSDFDGATMPIGMDDASMQPRITEALLRRGYSEDDIRKVLGGNLLRVMEKTEEASRRKGAQ